MSIGIGIERLCRKFRDVLKIASDAMYRAFISGYRLVEVSHGKPYYVYCIEVLEANTGTRYFVERRYSEFNALHRTLKKENTDIAPFPPKRVRNSQRKVLEQRREALELYMQKMLKLAATKQHVLNFLGIESRTSGTSQKRIQKDTSDDKYCESNAMTHHPILAFHSDPYLQPDSARFPDVVVSGVLAGMYKS